MKPPFEMLSLSLLALTLPLFSCSASDLAQGPYTVGFESYKTHDESRPYLMGEDTISRPLLIHFWYPSEEKVQGRTLNFKHYIDLISQRESSDKLASETDQISFNYVQAYSDFAKSHLGLDTGLRVQEILDAPVNARSGIPIQKKGAGFPLLIYAPSNGKASVQNHVICEYLASHGFMILSVASAGPNSIHRNDIGRSTLAQVMDMEYILTYCEDSMQIKYTTLGLFGFSSGGNAMTLFQMRNEKVAAIFSMDGGQEYGAYCALYRMPDFQLEKAKAPYCSLVNNYENFSIYPFYHSLHTSENYLFQMPYLDHNGFISHWSFFESCSPRSKRSRVAISYDFLCKCALGFFQKYLKPERSLETHSLVHGLDEEYIRPVSQSYFNLATLCNVLLDHDLVSADRLMDHDQTLFSGDGVRIGILARMLADSNIDQAIYLCLSHAENNPDSWQAHYDLAYMYKMKGEPVLSKQALMKAAALNPGNDEIASLLKELDPAE